MIHLALWGFALVAAQDSDRSTPEKACENFCRFYFGMRDREPEAGLEKKISEMEDFLYTEAARKKRGVQREEGRKRRAAWRPKGRRWAIGKRSDEKDGAALFVVTEILIREETDPKTREKKLVEKKNAHRFTFADVGGRWRVREIDQPCYRCDSTGRCRDCGKDETKSCRSCKGKRTCPTCEGKGYRKQKMDDLGSMRLALPDKDPAVSRDLSSPQGAANAFADVQRKMELERTRRMLAWMRKILDEAAPYFHPDLNKSIDVALKKAMEKGKERLEQLRPRVGEVKVTGDTAFAVLTRTYGEGAKTSELQYRLVLKKVGATWLIDGRQNKCWSCDGKGTCRTCKGTGKGAGGRECWGCKGAKACKQCEGSGWKDARF